MTWLSKGEFGGGGLAFMNWSQHELEDHYKHAWFKWNPLHWVSQKIRSLLMPGGVIQELKLALGLWSSVGCMDMKLLWWEDFVQTIPLQSNFFPSSTLLTTLKGCPLCLRLLLHSLILWRVSNGASCLASFFLSSAFWKCSVFLRI